MPRHYIPDFAFNKGLAPSFNAASRSEAAIQFQLGIEPQLKLNMEHAALEAGNILPKLLLQIGSDKCTGVDYMPQNDNILDDNNNVLDPFEMEDKPQSTYVPKFERDLAAMGSLEALSAAKKAKHEKEDVQTDPDSISVSGIDTSSLRSEEEYAELTVSEEETEFVSAQPDAEENNENLQTLNAFSADNEENPHYLYHTKSAEPEEERPLGKSFSDFAREAEEQERIRAEKEQERLALRSLEGVAAVQLSDMDYDDSKDRSRALMKQMQMDDLAMELSSTATVEEMSEEYAPTQKKAEDLSTKDVLDMDEKRLIKERLEKEIGKTPATRNQKTSLEMYHNLMNEQKIKKAKKGFFVVLLLVLCGIVCALITFFKLNWNEQMQAFDEENKLGGMLMYLPIATGFFSLILLLKAKPFKICSCVYFALNTVVLIGPGFIKFALDTNQRPETYIQTLIFYIIAILLSALVCIQLCTSENVDAYYTTHLLTEKKKVFDDRKSKYRQ